MGEPCAKVPPLSLCFLKGSAGEPCAKVPPPAGGGGTLAKGAPADSLREHKAIHWILSLDNDDESIK